MDVEDSSPIDFSLPIGEVTNLGGEDIMRSRPNDATLRMDVEDTSLIETSTSVQRPPVTHFGGGLRPEPSDMTAEATASTLGSSSKSSPPEEMNTSPNDKDLLTLFAEYSVTQKLAIFIITTCHRNGHHFNYYYYSSRNISDFVNHQSYVSAGA